MDENAQFERIRSSPDNVEFLSEYTQWLSEKSDRRGEYLTTELAFRNALERVHQLGRRMRDLTLTHGLDLHWLDVVHPLKVRALTSGKFYTAPGPGDSPYVSPGDACQSTIVVGILEIGTVPNQIAAGHAAYVAEVVAEDGQPVAGGDILLKLARLPLPTAVD